MTGKQEFNDLMTDLAADIAGRQLNADLNAYLNDQYGPTTDRYRTIEAVCRNGVAEGWLADRQGGAKIKFSRPIKPGPDMQNFSVDVVEMDDVVGPHHRHPNGEIDMIIPLDEGAEFDGKGAGWLVYGPDTAHHPTVTGGKAIILYLLPEGAIEFTKQ
ncbi:MAG: DUF4863 family protein [Pseudomonadota bacterium]